jgi:hypothetical protein
MGWKTPCAGSGTGRGPRCRGAVLAALLLLSGCGYHQQSLFPAEVRSVAVPIFQNRTFYQGLEFEVTEAIIKEIELQTPYKVTGQGSADTILEGSIVDVRQHRLSRTRDGGLVQELEFAILLSFEWRNLRTGKVLRRRDGMEVVGRYVPTRPVGEPVDVGQHMAATAIAQGIVSAMRSDW